jgi:hypothetical protein
MADFRDLRNVKMRINENVCRMRISVDDRSGVVTTTVARAA